MTKRRKKGTGSVDQYRGRWRWRIAGREGYADTRAEAEVELRFWREELSARPPVLTVWTYLDEWMDERELEGRVKWPDRERASLRAYVEPYEIFHTKPLTKLRRQDCVAWIRELERGTGKRGKPLGKRTIQNAKALVHRALEDAVDRGLITGNPLHGARVIGGTEKRAHDWLRPDEVEAVLALELSLKQRAVITVAIFTGLSPLELWSLRWQHVDLKARMLHVRGLVKRSSRVRDVPLIRGADTALSEWKHEQLIERRRRAEQGEVARVSPYVFPSATGTRLRIDADPAKWKDKAYTGRDGNRKVRLGVPKLAGIERHIVFRDLRHTFASNLVSGSWGPAIPLERLAYLMGHSDARATQIYAHLHPDGPIAAMRRLDHP